METKSEDKFLEEAKRRIKYAHGAWSVNYTEMDDDARYLANQQWDDHERYERELDGRPCLTFNRLAPYVDQVVGDQRKTEPAIKVYAVNNDSATENKNVTGDKDYSTAEIYEGLIRSIESNSAAELAYNAAFDHAVSWGLGFIKLSSEYLSGDFDQELRISSVPNYKSVLIDPDFEETSGKDARWAFHFSKILKEEAEKKYPGKELASLDVDSDMSAVWVDGDFIFLAEYFYLKEEKRTLYQLSDGRIVGAEAEKVLDELEIQGIEVIKEREISVDICYRALICEGCVLEASEETVFSGIPIVPVIGREVVVEGTRVLRGVIRHSKEAQDMYNYSRSAEAERTGLIPKVPYIIADKQVAGYEDQWQEANSENAPFLLYRHVDGVQKPSREPPPMGNPGESAQSQQSIEDIRSTSGIYDANPGGGPVAQSGAHESLLQTQASRGNYIFSSNLLQSMKQVGRMLIDAIPKVYDTDRVLRLRLFDDAEDFVRINEVVYDYDTGEEATLNDLNVGKFDLTVKAGLSHETQRQEASRQITALVSSVSYTDPILSKALVMMAAQNADWPNADKVVELIKKTLPEGLTDSPSKDDGEMTEAQRQEAKSKEQEQMLQKLQLDTVMAKAEADKAAAQAKLATADATVQKAEASEYDSRAKMLEITQRMEGFETDQRNHIMGMLMQAVESIEAEQSTLESPTIQR